MRARRKQEGFTLTEVMVSVFLLTVGLFSAGSTMLAVHRSHQLSGTLMTATNLAQSRMEDLKAATYDAVAGLTENYGEITDHPSYRRVTTVTPNADDTLKSVTVTVVDSTGASIELQSLMARR